MVQWFYLVVHAVALKRFTVHGRSSFTGNCFCWRRWKFGWRIFDRVAAREKRRGNSGFVQASAAPTTTSKDATQIRAFAHGRFGAMVEPPLVRNTETSDGAASRSTCRRSCQLCRSGNSDNDKMRAVWLFSEKQQQKESELHRGDDLMQCLDCSFTGCAPRSVCSSSSSSSNEFSKQHTIQHFLTSNHKYGACAPGEMNDDASVDSCGREHGSDLTLFILV